MEVLKDTSYDKLKTQQNFLGKGAFGGVYKLKVNGEDEAWKFVTIDTYATNCYKISKYKGIDGREWDRQHVYSRMKEIKGFDIMAGLEHPNIVAVRKPMLFHRSNPNEYLDHKKENKHRTMIHDQRFELILRMDYVSNDKGGQELEHFFKRMHETGEYLDEKEFKHIYG